MFKQKIYVVNPIKIKSLRDNGDHVGYTKEILDKVVVVCRGNNGRECYYNALTREEYKVLDNNLDILEISVGDIVIVRDDLILFDEYIDKEDENTKTLSLKR